MPFTPNIGLVNSHILSTGAPESIGRRISAAGLPLGTAVWPTANKAIFVPVTVYEPLLIVNMFLENGAAAGGNVDLGIYDIGGSRIVSSGAILQSGTSAIQQFEIADTTLEPGYYYLAASFSNVTGTSSRYAPNAAYARSFGVAEMTSAHPLPATAVFAALSSNFIPVIYATTRSVI